MANKEASVAELTESFRSSNAVLLTEYRGLTVAQLKQLRSSISAPLLTSSSKKSSVSAPPIGTKGT